MPDQSKKSDYYYVSGKKVPLVPAKGMVAVRSEEVDTKLSNAEDLEEIKTASQELRGGMAIVDRRDLTERASKELQQHSVAGPVFEGDGGLLIPLPEVRIEDSDDAKISQVGDWLRANAALVEVVSKREGRIVVKPVSDNPEDALDIANRVTEEVGPAMAQARFLRCVERPGPKTQA